jgi:drug/metabolite transporter (DMT)-like permease
MLFGAVGLLLLALLSREPLPSPTPQAWLAWGYLVLGGSLVGFTSYVQVLRRLPTPVAMTYAYVNPIVAVLLGAAFAGEVLTMRTLVAAALIIGSVALVITAQQLRLRAEPQISAAVTPAD